jgi:lysophospholipid acyltransferase (LPLAT)-like uncharacterized protein
VKHPRTADWLGWVVGVVARLWLSTLRVRVQYDPALEPVRDRPWVLAFWHGTQWPLLAWRRRRRTVVLVSWSRDGALQARALAMQGLCVVRGSSSRGGARGLAALVDAMQRERADSAFAVDGPRGPRDIAKAGAVVAARATGAVVVPMAGAVRCGLVLRRSWDHFAIAWPFTRVDVTLGRPIDPTGDAREEVERAIRQLNADLAEPFAAEASARRGRSRRFPLGRPGVVPPPERWIAPDTVQGKSVRTPR